MNSSNDHPDTVVSADGSVVHTAAPVPVERPNPPLDELFKQKVMHMALPRFVTESNTNMDHAQVVEHLHASRKMLPVLTAEYESRLLGQAGEFPTPMTDGTTRIFKYPPCWNHAECVANTRRLPGFTLEEPGCVLMGLMYPEEFDAFVNTGRVPQPRPCILCARFDLNDWCVSLRPNYQRLGIVDRSVVLQLYRNLVDQPHGYSSEYVFHPLHQRYEGFIDPIAALRVSALRAFKDPQQGGRWMIDQSVMFYRHDNPLLPRVGESLQVTNPSLLKPPPLPVDPVVRQLDVVSSRLKQMFE